MLFHAKDLWAEGLNNPAPRPDEGNGSGASCHGACSPRYINDPACLETPELGGTAAYTVPMEVVRTDPVYAEAMQSLRARDGGFPEATPTSRTSSTAATGPTAIPRPPILLAPPP